MGKENIPKHDLDDFFFVGAELIIMTNQIMEELH